MSIYPLLSHYEREAREIWKWRWLAVNATALALIEFVILVANLFAPPRERTLTLRLESIRHGRPSNAEYAETGLYR